MLRVILCDDNLYVLDYYKSLLKSAASENQIDIKLTCFESGEQLLFNLSDSPNMADIIYLDILMGQTNGIETARRLREIGCVATLVYLTTSNEYVFEAFDTNPFYYIGKDEMPEKKFKDVFLKAVNSVSLKRNSYILATVGSTNLRLALDKIKYFDVQNRLITAHTADSDVEYYYRLDELEQDLRGKGFMRIHRSFLVNCFYIQKLSRTQLTLLDGTELPVSAKYSDAVKDAFSNYLIQV